MNGYDKMTYEELAQVAYDIQDACNLLAVVNHFALVIRRLRDLGKQTDGLYGKDADPVVILFTDKIAHLTKTQWAQDRDQAEKRAYAAIVPLVKVRA